MVPFATLTSSIATVLSALILFTQGTQSFCIYNSFSDGTVFDVTEVSGGTILPSQQFHKWMTAGDQECCNYKDTDCSTSQNNNDPAQFQFIFHFPTYTSGSYTIQCTTGGGLEIYGNEASYWATCTDAYGNSHTLDMSP